MQVSIITLFPQIFREIFSVSIIKRAQEQGKIKINLIDLREFGIGKLKIVDDKPYGGGTGMVLRVDVVARAIEASRMKIKRESVILLDPKGKKYDQVLRKVTRPSLNHSQKLVGSACLNILTTQGPGFGGVKRCLPYCCRAILPR